MMFMSLSDSTTGATSGAGTANSSGAPESEHGFEWGTTSGAGTANSSGAPEFRPWL